MTDGLMRAYLTWGLGYLEDVRQEAACTTLAATPEIPAAYYKRVVQVLARGGYTDQRISWGRSRTRTRERLHIAIRHDTETVPLWMAATPDPSDQAALHERLAALPRWLIALCAEGFVCDQPPCLVHPMRYWYLTAVSQRPYVACHVCRSQRAQVLRFSNVASQRHAKPLARKGDLCSVVTGSQSVSSI